MKHNPFTSASYTTIWLKHFNASKKTFTFEFINGLKFVKHWLLPLHVNVGKNLTKGIYYNLNYSASDYKGKTLLIYDVPTYFNLDNFILNSNSSLRLIKLFQYKGFLMNISSFKDYEEYIRSQFNSKNRREFKSNIRRLEDCFNIKYSFLHGNISKTDFDIAFNHFYKLLNKRFSDKQTNYHHLSETKWNFYKELVFEMLQNKQASLLIIYSDDIPIGITLNFHSENILFETITVFDPDYYKFSIGKTSIIKLLEWCFENNYKISDFSKGDFDYKHKWANYEYDFNYHIFYDSSSLKSILTAKFVELFFKTKLFLREKNINLLYRKCIYFVNDKLKRNNDPGLKYKTEKIDNFMNSDDFKLIDYTENKFSYLLQSLYVFMYANPEPIKNIRVYQDSKSVKTFIIKGSKKAQKLIFN